MMYPPSMIAAGSVGAAVHGLSNMPHLDEKLLQKLHEITGIEMVSFVSPSKHPGHWFLNLQTSAIHFIAPGSDIPILGQDLMCMMESLKI